MKPDTYRSVSTGERAEVRQVTIWNGVIRAITLRTKSGEYLRLSGAELRAEWRLQEAA